MDRNISRAFYKTAEWRRCREAYIKHVDGLCERCLKNKTITPGYMLHHKIILNESNIKDTRVTLNWDNIEYLCLICHNKTHGTDRKATAEGLMFDSNGQLVES